MAYQLDWIVENRVMLVQNSGVMTGDDIQALTAQYKAMMDKAIAPVHIIEDNRHLESVEQLSLDTITTAFSEDYDWSKMGHAVVIAPDGLEVLADIFGNITDFLTHMDYERVDTMPEALEFVQEHDATLPEKSEWHIPQLEA